MREGPTCELGERRRIRWWSPKRDRAPRFASDVGPLAALASRDVEGGTLSEVEIPQGAQALVVDDGGGHAKLTLAEPEVLPDELRAARRALDAGELDEALAILARPHGPFDEHAATIAIGLRARVALRRSDESALPLLAETIARHARQGRVSEASDDAFALAFTLHRLHRFSESRRVLEETAPRLAAYPDGRVRAAYHGAILSEDAGDVRATLRQLTDAEREAERLGLTRLSRIARQEHAMRLVLLGRVDEGTTILRQLSLNIPAEIPTCDVVDAWINLGWAAFVRSEQASSEGRTAAPIDVDPEAAYSKGIELDDHGCNDVRKKANGIGEWAGVALARGDIATARSRLVTARALVPAPDAMLDFDLIDREGEIALAAGDGKGALAAYDRLRARGSSAGWIGMAWRAAWGRAEALRLLGKTEEALTASVEGEALVERDLRWVPVGEGRTSFLDARSATSRQRVEILLSQGRDAEAFVVARRARARSVRALERADRIAALLPTDRARWEAAIDARWRARDAMEADARDDWRRLGAELADARAARHAREIAADDALDAEASSLAGFTPTAAAESYPPPPAGVVEILYLPMRDGWIGMASTHDAIAVRRLGRIDATAPAATLATQMLQPFADQVQSATRLWILPMGPLRAVDVHALPWRGAPLFASIVVEYPLDVGDGRSRSDVSRGRALIVGDAANDLPAARVEATDVAALLSRSEGPRVDRWVGGQVTRLAVEDGLRAADLFHYAGHGIFAGTDGWQSALSLADGSTLTIGDILALPRVPPWVVLSGCETGRSDQQAMADGLGLAQAFALAGARGVVASTRPVNDRVAADLMHALYADVARAPSTPLDLGASLRRAAIELLHRAPESDVAAFRTLRR